MSRRKIIEWTLASLDSVFTGEGTASFMDYADDAYFRDGLGQLLACDAALVGRTTYERFAALWPDRDHPWAGAMNAIPKYVFSSTLEGAAWANSTIVRGDVVEEVSKLKQQPGGDLLIWGHGRLAQTLMKHGLIDVLDLSIHPLLLGTGEALFRDGLQTTMRLMAVKTFAGGIVKLTYEPRPA